jgi:hypothetical protein
VTYQVRSAFTTPAGIVKLYCPALSIAVCATRVKLDWPASSCHSTTWSPATGLESKAPEMTTLCPSVEGFGEEAIVGLAGHIVAPQQVPEGVEEKQQVAGQQMGSSTGPRSAF